MEDAWEKIKAELSKRLGTGAYQNWIARTSFSSLEDGELTVRVPDKTSETWIRQEYTPQIQAAVERLRLPVEHIVYQVGAQSAAIAAGQARAVTTQASDTGYSFAANGPLQAQAAAAGQRTAAAFPAPAERSNGNHPQFELTFEPPGAWLNPRLTFDTYVVGSSNQLAHAAAMAVATNPSGSYNPLFIYGGVGIGKTHLMHAIGAHLIQSFPGLNVIYTSSERFMNEMIASIKLDRMTQFHRHYRTADVLLVDDIQVLAGKERTQEEFFHTFNELYDHRKQIVISSDSAPNQTSGLVERLRSRFEWGLMVDVQPPDLETKMAILDKKAESEGINLPQDVRIFLATRTKSNVRELEGALTRLLAVSSVTRQPITLAMANHTLKHLSTGPERRITVDSILKAVGEQFQLTTAQLKMKSNTRQIAYPRQIAMYLVKDLTQASLPEIGRYFGGKHHTTVLHSVQKIDELRHHDEDLNKLILSLIDRLQRT